MTTKFGLIAVRGETAPLLKYIIVEATEARIQARFHPGNLAGREVILAEVGPGKVQTAAATQHLIDRYEVSLLISCGSAGALDAQLRVEDVILANKVVLHDAGLHKDSGFQHLGIYDNTRPDGLHYHRYLPADMALLATAQQAAQSATWPKAAPAIKVGCLASGDQIIASERKKRWLAETFGALAVDMESGAMAQVAFLNNIPWLAIRAVSDGAGPEIDFDLASLIIYSDELGSIPARFQQTTSKMAGLVKQPHRLKTILQVRRAIQQASKHAAQLTAAVVSQL